MRAIFALGRFVAGWLVFFAFYLLFAMQWQGDELAAGAIVSGLVVALLTLIRRRSDASFVVRWRWLWLLARRVPGQALADCAVLLGALWQGTNEGEFCAVPFDTDTDDQPGEAAARLALVIAGASVSPNSVVVAVDHTQRRLLVHQLVPTPRPPGGGDRRWPL